LFPKDTLDLLCVDALGFRLPLIRLLLVADLVRVQRLFRRGAG
jgi:hypothetical protein